MIAAGYSGARKLWSWRRDLNPRPSDYKSDALPAELRQPEQPCCLPQDRITIAKVTTVCRIVEGAGVESWCYHSSTDEGGKPDLACPGAPRRPSSLFCSFWCWCAGRVPAAQGAARGRPAASRIGLHPLFQSAAAARLHPLRPDPGTARPAVPGVYRRHRF